MYRSDLKNRDKGGAIVAVVAIHAGLLFVFLHLSGKVDLTDPQAVMRVFDVNEVPPPQSTPEPPTPAQETERPKEQEGAASAENIRSQATPVVAPKPPIPLPIPAAGGDDPDSQRRCRPDARRVQRRWSGNRRGRNRYRNGLRRSWQRDRRRRRQVWLRHAPGWQLRRSRRRDFPRHFYERWPRGVGL